MSRFGILVVAEFLPKLSLLLVARHKEVNVMLQISDTILTGDKT